MRGYPGWPAKDGRKRQRFSAPGMAHHDHRFENGENKCRAPDWLPLRRSLWPTRSSGGVAVITAMEPKPMRVRTSSSARAWCSAPRQDNKGMVQRAYRAYTPAGRFRSVFPTACSAGQSPSGHTARRVQRAQIGIDFLRQIAGQKTALSPASTAPAHQRNALDRVQHHPPASTALAATAR